MPNNIPKTAYDIPSTPLRKGMIQEEVMSFEVAPKDSVAWLENASDDTLGEITTRREFDYRGTMSATVTNGAIFNQMYNSDKAIMYTQQGRDLIQQNLISSGGTATYSNFFANTNKNRYDTLLGGYLLMTNNGNTPSVYYATGNTSTPTSMDTEFPNSVDLISAGFIGRVWGASSSGASRVYYSDVLPADWPSTALTTAAQQYLTINTRGEAIRALVQTPSILYVFSNNYIFRIANVNSVENSPLYNVGTVSQESVVKTRDGYYFYHYSGIYFLSNSGALQPVSDQIYYLIKSVPVTSKKSVFGWSKDKWVYFYLGNLTGRDSNKYYTIKLNTYTGSWSLISTRTAITCAIQGALSEFGATETSTTEDWYPASVVFNSDNVYATLDVVSPSTDGQDTYGDFKSSGNIAENIFVDVVSHWETFENERMYKQINGLSIAHEKASGFSLFVQYDNDNESTWHDVGVLNSEYITLFRDFKSEGFYRCRFRVTGITTGTRVKFSMPTVLELDNLGFKHG
jgi:hypothetical protein